MVHGERRIGHRRSAQSVNDHPADKASYDISFNVPAGTTAVANSDLVFRRTSHGRSYSTYFMREPMASELIQLAVGEFDVTHRPSVDRVKIRDVSSSSVTDAIEPALARTPDHLRWMIDQVGRYPFNEYGVLAGDEPFFYALETQTLSLHPALLFVPPFTSRSWSTSSPTSGSATAWRRCAGRTSGSTGATRTTTSRCTRRSSSSATTTPSSTGATRTAARTSSGTTSAPSPARPGTTSSRCSATTCIRAAARGAALPSARSLELGIYKR